MNEHVLQRKCLGWIKKTFPDTTLAVNIHGGGFSNKGFPDLIVFGNQKAIVIELKAGTGYQLQTEQKLWRERFKKVGTHHYVIDNIEDFKSIIQEEFDETQKRIQ